MTDSPLPRRARVADVEPLDRLDDQGLLRQVLVGLSSDRDLEACKGELLVHADGRVECLDDPRCSTDPALHVGVVRCDEDLDDGCCSRTA